MLGIQLARLYRKSGKLDDAVRILDLVLGARAKAGIFQDEDDAVLLYNKACYLNLLSRDKLDRCGVFNAASTAALSQALTIRSDFLADAEKNPDLKGINFDQLRKGACAPA